MINLIHAELYKIRKTGVFKIGVLITAVCAFVLGVLCYNIGTGAVDIPMQSLSGLSDIFIMSVMGPLMAGVLICNDFDSKNIHDEISCGRWAIVFSKSVVYLLLVAVLVLPYAIVGFIGFVTETTFASPFAYSTYLTLMVNKAGYVVDGTNIAKSIVVLAISLLLYAARLSFCIPVAFKVRKTVAVTVIGVVVGFVIDFIINVLSKIPGVDTLVKFTPYSTAIVTMENTSGELWRIVGSSVLFIVIMIAITYGIFKKAEIK